MNRFIRDYELVVTLLDGTAVKIVPEIRVKFEVQKSVRGGLNSCKIQIYNLGEEKRKNLVKDKDDKSTKLNILLKAGYEKIETVFKGTILEASSMREGADIVTTISALDGGHDAQTAFTSKTVKSNSVSHILEDMQNVKQGKITQKNKLFRPKVLVGNSLKLIEESLDVNETMFIENEDLHIIKDDEVISGDMPLIDSSTGLLNDPVKKNNDITFTTLLNPFVKIGGLVELKSQISPYLNGIYKINSIKTRGDINGKEWEQVCTGTLAKNYKVVK